jgi:hypothetical protein
MRQGTRTLVPAAARVLACLPLALSCLLGGCATNGDFGRVRPSLVHDDIHAWMGPAATGSVGEPASRFDLTDDERLLRDLGYPLLEPPYHRQRWYSVLNEYGLTRGSRQDWVLYDRAAYGRKLLGHGTRSASARYAQLNDDVRNDVVRVGPFLGVAARVGDMDRKREQSLAFVSELTPDEELNALARNRENALIVAWVCRSLKARIDNYQYALERLVIATPSPAALEGERSLTLLRNHVAACYAPPAYLLPPEFGGPRDAPKGLVAKG